MNYSQLNTYIKAALPQRTLSIAKGKLTKNIDELLKYCFGSKALVINNLQLENEDEASKTIIVSGATTSPWKPIPKPPRPTPNWFCHWKEAGPSREWTLATNDQLSNAKISAEYTDWNDPSKDEPNIGPTGFS